jgi:hypothetical protein
MTIAEAAGKAAAAAPGLTIKPLLEHYNEFPAVLREGPWKKTCLAYVVLFAAGLAVTAPQALAEYPATASRHLAPEEATLAVLCLVWIRYVFKYTLREFGPFPLISHSMVIWLMIGLRLACSLMAPFSMAAQGLGEVIYSTILLHSVLLFVGWWLVIFPGVLLTAPDAHQRYYWITFNTSFFLVQMHVVAAVMVWCIYAVGRGLVLFDLWSSLACGYIYMFMFQITVCNYTFVPST